MTNPAGAKQSAIEGAWHLLDSKWFDEVFGGKQVEGFLLCRELLKARETIERGDQIELIRWALDSIPNYPDLVTRTMATGVLRYGPDNWRGIPFEDHINHAVRHWFIYKDDPKGNQEDYEHFICRAYMALCKLLRPEFYGVWSPVNSDANSLFPTVDVQRVFSSSNCAREGFSPTLSPIIADMMYGEEPTFTEPDHKWLHPLVGAGAEPRIDELGKNFGPSNIRRSDLNTELQRSATPQPLSDPY